MTSAVHAWGHHHQAVAVVPAAGVQTITSTSFLMPATNFSWVNTGGAVVGGGTLPPPQNLMSFGTFTPTFGLVALTPSGTATGNCTGGQMNFGGPTDDSIQRLTRRVEDL